jgi:L-seryl-tRNA(Ser) seleniumtransferase
VPSRRSLPAVYRFFDDAAIAAFAPLLGRAAVKESIRSVLDGARTGLDARGAALDFADLRAQVLELLHERSNDSLVRLINGTGVLLHTNLGRAPLAPAALEAVARLGAGYTNLEYDLTAGARGERYDRVASLLCEVSGAEASLVVNNCAAAVLLALDTFARGREVIVSRGQMIEIGGSFRLPDVVRKSGATLVEVGTTNRTYGRDYRDAWTENTAMLVRTHPSNYRIDGFVAEVNSAALAAIAKEIGVISFEDLGSGALVDLAKFGLPHEPTVAGEISAGIDLVAISGDKLLGGPQCGILFGKRKLIEAMQRNPLLRALRVDKMTLAALSATLACYAEPDRLREVPLFEMLSRDAGALFDRAAALCAELSKQSDSVLASFAPVRTIAAAGGGSLPATDVPSAGVAALPLHCSIVDLAQRLRRHDPPVVGRIENGALVFDLRTIDPRDDRVLVDALAHAVRTP